MQKLLQRNPASSPLLCSFFKTAFLSFQPFKPHNTKPTKFPSFPPGSHPFATTAETQFLFPAGMSATAGFCGGSSSFAAAVAKKATVVRPAVSSSTIFAPCRSAIDTRATPLRAWVATRPAWYCTVPVPAPDAPVTAAATAAAVEGLRSSEGEGGENGEKEEKGVEEKGAKLSSRRQKGSGDVVGDADLLTIPGVGPKNLRKLVEKGFRKMAELKQFYKDKFLGKSNDTMVEYLQSSVGIIHRNHAQSITNFIKESVDEELKDLNSDVKAAIKKRLTFCVEGNISVGKTTFLQRIVSDTIELRDLVEVVPEPVDKWQDVGPDHFNILDAFYAEPHRYAYTFQNYVFVTRVMQERESSGGLKPLRLMERSVFSDRMVFVRAVHEAKWMNEMEISIYDSWFDPVVSALPGLIPDGFIYLRASPDTCHKRMKLRKREEEGGVTLDYLRDLHEKHESWLFPFQSGNHGVLSVTKLPSSLDPTLHPEIRDRVFYLEGDHMHRSIQKVPALVLDCEVNIDLNRDIEAKEHYARQVSEFFKYVKNIKEAAPPKAGEGGLLSNRQILLPHEGGLMLPHGEKLRQALSFMPGK